MISTKRSSRALGLSALASTVLALLVSAGGRAAPPPPEWHAKADPWVVSALEKGEAEMLVVLEEQADLSAAARLRDKDAKGRFVFERLRETAERTQKPLRDWLAARGIAHRPMWIANMIWVRAGAAEAAEIAARPEVARLSANPRVRMEEPIESPASELPQSPDAIEWGVLQINADDVWAAGYTGQTIVVGGADTGYHWQHPALRDKYRGWNGTTGDHDYNWHDSIHTGGGTCGPNSTSPCDDGSHGTHTMGTMVGDDGGPNQIGVAPGAKWIGCRNMDQGNGTPATYSECFQWFIAPTTVAGTNPDTTKAPHVINNSWSCPASEGCTDPAVLQTVVENTRAAGIVVVVSAGNGGPNCSTVSTPAAIYEASFSVGATNSSDVIAGFSSRGPVTADGSNRLKPNVSAPGVSVRSSIPNTGYASFSGTSMAGPHVAGATALLLSAYGIGLIGNVDAVETALEQSAFPLTSMQTCGGIPGTAIPNNTYGFGRIDVLAAAVSLSSNTTVSIADSSDPTLAGQPLTYTVTVGNGGPAAALGVTLIDTLPIGAAVGSVTPSQGSCGPVTTTVACALGTIASGGSATVAIVVTPAAAGSLTNSAVVGAVGPDFSPADNSDSETTTVTTCPSSPPVITAPASAPPATTGLTASVPSVPGHTYTWTLSGGTITGGQGTSQLTFTAGTAGTRMILGLSDDVVGAGCTAQASSKAVQVHFLDVPPAHAFHSFVNTIARNAVTVGCGGGNYCPDSAVTREQMAVFLLLSKEGEAYLPPVCTTPVFPDAPCASPFATWINELSVRGVTAGCGGGNFCPLDAVTREQMSVFLLRTLEGPLYTPPACTTAPFGDVPCSSPFARWIQEIALRGITAGCGGGDYCPLLEVTRGQMAVFLVGTFSLI